MRAGSAVGVRTAPIPAPRPPPARRMRLFLRLRARRCSSRNAGGVCIGDHLRNLDENPGYVIADEPRIFLACNLAVEYGRMIAKTGGVSGVPGI